MKKLNNKHISSASAAICAAVYALSSLPAAAATENVGGEADIIQSATLTKTDDLQFGRIIAGPTASTVVIDEDTEVRTVTGTAVAFGGTVSAAKIDVNANPLLLYSIILPPTVAITSGSNAMVIDDLKLNIPAVRLLPLGAPIDDFQIGGRLNIGANQAPGNYSGSFVVTVNFF